MVMAPRDSFSVPVCKGCGEIFVHGIPEGSCPGGAVGLGMERGQPGDSHDIEYRTAQLLPKGLKF